jgi:hypothetical protein
VDRGAVRRLKIFSARIMPPAARAHMECAPTGFVFDHLWAKTPHFLLSFISYLLSMEFILILPQFLQFFKQLRLFSCEKLRAILKLSRVAYRTTPSTATKGANHYADERVFHRQPEG